MRKVVAVLEVMWGDVDLPEAPRFFRINHHNLSGKRLYKFLGHTDLLVTNACPQMVDRASGRGETDPQWLSDNIRSLWPFELLLVCGKKAQETYRLSDTLEGRQRSRVIELPHPANRTWTRQALDLTRRYIQEGKSDLHLELIKSKLVVTKLVPF